MTEVRTNPEILGNAVVDGINEFVRNILAPRCPTLADLRSGPDAQELDRLKYEIAVAVASRWAVSRVDDEMPRERRIQFFGRVADVRSRTPAA